MRSLRFVAKLASRNLRSDWFGTLCAIIGVALGTATVSVVLTIDVNTAPVVRPSWISDPTALPDLDVTVGVRGIRSDTGEQAFPDRPREENQEDYQVMRSAIRLGSLSAYLVGALIVFFTFRVIIVQRKREIALLRSIGATPRQIAGVFLAEAIAIGVTGAAIGIVLTPPLAYTAAYMGITTTGLSRLYWLWFPWKRIGFVAAVGAFTALLGIAKPLWDVLRLDVAGTLRPHFIDDHDQNAAQRSGMWLLALPFMVLVYALVRPFFVNMLPSLAFFVLESGLVCVGFVSVLVLVPQVVGWLGKVIAWAVPQNTNASGLLTLRRIERSGHEVAWAVSGVMLVFALLLSLHIMTLSLKNEVRVWGANTVRDNAYVYTTDSVRMVPPDILAGIPKHVIQVRYSSRSPLPHMLLAADEKALHRFAESVGTENAAPLLKLTKGKVILSTMMALRHDVGVGDFLEVVSKHRTARLEIVGVTDAGYVPMVGSYRDSKTYGLLSDADYDLIAPYTSPLGVAVAARDPTYVPEASNPWGPWIEHIGMKNFEGRRGTRIDIGRFFEEARVVETDDDFLIFDLILLLTAFLAAVGIANNLVLSAHIRRKEIALYRVLGMRSAQIRRLFVLEGTLIGALGGTLAVALGVPLGLAVIGALAVISAFDVTFVLPPMYAVYTIVAAMVISLASAIYPAIAASSVSSAESIHYE